MEYLEKAAKQAKQVVKQARYQMEGLTEVEILARECTNSDPWYAGGTDPTLTCMRHTLGGLEKAR